MTRFLDGPAEGVQLMLSRSPVFVRVCVSPGGIDCLDMPDDEPAEGEVLYAYARQGKPTVMMIDYTNRRTKKRLGKRLVAAEYRVMADQPSATTMADSELWRQWCKDQWPNHGGPK